MGVFVKTLFSPLFKPTPMIMASRLNFEMLGYAS